MVVERGGWIPAYAGMTVGGANFFPLILNLLKDGNGGGKDGCYRQLPGNCRNTPLPPPPNPVRLSPLSDANGGAADDDFAFGYGSRPLAG